MIDVASDFVAAVEAGDAVEFGYSDEAADNGKLHL